MFELSQFKLIACLMYFCLTVPSFPQSNVPSSQQSHVPVSLKGPEVTDALQIARSYSSDVFPQFVVDGETPFNQKTMAVQELIFKPGSKLILTGSFGDKSDRYIIAETIRIAVDLSAKKPAITWQRDAPLLNNPEIGPAPNGYPSGGDGSPGTPGTDGQVGNPGFPGRNAPTLYIFVRSIEVSGASTGEPGLSIDLRGQDGGPGGMGQKGGDGGNGRAGRPGVSSAFDCRSGGQNGGAGGNGGEGGKGGPGGRGGNGGVVVIGSVSFLMNQLPHWLSVVVNGGIGGKGGEGGTHGEGGLGGLGGSGSAFCGGGAAGPGGTTPKKNGIRGDDGQNGADGAFGVVVLSNDQLSSLGIRQAHP